MIDMIVVPRIARRKNLECGDKSRAVRGSRYRFLAAPCAETLLVPTLSRLRQRRSVSTKCVGRSVGTKCVGRSVESKCRDVWPAAPLLHTPCRYTFAQKAASRGIPLAAALQILSSDLQSRRHPIKISASPRLCVKKLSTFNFLRAGTPALPTAYAQNTRSTRMTPVTNRLRGKGF